MAQGALKRVEDAEALGRVAPLFGDTEETCIWACLHDTMGDIWVLDGQDEPYRSAVAACGDFHFVAGEPDAALLAAYHAHYGSRFTILTPQSEAWIPLMQAEYGDSGYLKERYAICKDGDCFDRARLEAFARALPEGVTLARIDGALYERCMASDWAQDFCSLFKSRQDYAERGLGVVALLDGEIVGGASSYWCFPGGIEIEVDTREDMRRKGIATACAARLILDCLERGLYPSWDAANRISVALAQKLGYREKGAYIVMKINEAR